MPTDRVESSHWFMEDDRAGLACQQPSQHHAAAVLGVEPGGGGDIEVDAAAHQLQAGGLERMGHRPNLIGHRSAVQQAVVTFGHGAPDPAGLVC